MNSTIGRLRVFWLILVGFGVVFAFTAEGISQSRVKLKDSGLLPLVPNKAVFIFERRGRETIDAAVRASNFGKLVKDDAVQAMVNDSRVKVGKLIISQMFNIQDTQLIAKHHKQLHSMLKPFWYKPCAIFLTADDEFSESPGIGVYCVLDNKNRQECHDAIKALMAFGVTANNTDGTRHAFTYKSAGVVWEGVAKGRDDWTLPNEADKQREILENKTLFM
ncbi:MAG TPA: hypothetical protein ENL03_02345, partial [Phycisphaerae bacterium]|nr:hypothetical protein [Phycisphaerae bacterium]